MSKKPTTTRTIESDVSRELENALDLDFAQERDKADCQNMASAQANSSASWAQVFTGCMSGRGYLVQ